MLNLTDVRIEYQQKPLGLWVPRPRFSWRLDTDRSNVWQVWHQVRVARDPAIVDLVWDSERVATDASTQVEYGGPALQPRCRYWVSVQIGDNHEEISPWSAPTWFETGMGDVDQWRADWITADPEAGHGQSADAFLLRRQFHLDRVPENVRIYVTSLGLYALYLNGRRVGDWLFTPGWTSYRHRLQYQTFDVSGWLQPGDNVVAAMVANGWYAGELGWAEARDASAFRRALLLELHEVGDQDRIIVASDDQWRHHPGPIQFSELYHGETYDARREVMGWSEPRGDEASFHPVAILDHGKEMLIAQENLPTRVTETLSPLRVVKTPNGETVIDFGQNLTGRVRIRGEMAENTELRLRHAEVLDREGNFYTENLRKARQTVTYIAKGGGVEDYAPEFSFQGFRYVHVDPPELAASLTFTAEVIHTDLENTMEFECSEPLINQLQHNIVWSQRGNFLDVPTDCPQRDERLGWTGDAQVFVATAGFNMQVAPFFTKWLHDLACDQLPSGSVPHVIPQVLEAQANGSTAWADAAVICPWTIYRQYGDVALLRAQYPSMQAWVEYMRSSGPHADTFEMGFHYGDWLGLDAASGSYVGATAKAYISNAFYAYSTGILAKAAQVLGQEADRRTYSTLYRDILSAFREEFVTPRGRIAVPTQTAHVLALAFELVEPVHRARVLQDLVDLIAESGNHLTTGFVGTPYLLHVLSQFGATDVAYQLLLRQQYPSWLYPISQGATTIWEHWDGIRPDGSFWSPAMNSFNHYAYGAVGDWLYQVVAGIRPGEDRPGFQDMVIQPKPGDGLTWASARYRCGYGVIESSWSLEAGRFRLKVTVPPNARATVIFPHGNFTDFETDGDSAALNMVAVDPWIQVGSGTYHFSYAI